MPPTLDQLIALVHARAAVLSARCADGDGAAAADARDALDAAETDLEVALAGVADDTWIPPEPR